MSVAPVDDRSAKEGIRSLNCAGIALALLVVSLPAEARAGSTAAAGAPAEAGGQATPLDQLSTTIGNLKARLSTIRQDLDVLHEAPGAPPTADQLCASLAGPDAERDTAAQELERLHAQVEAERAGWRRSEAAADTELARLRQRLADAGADAARLHDERTTLASRVAELEQALRQARTSDVVAALARRPPTSPIETAAAAEPEATPPYPAGPKPTEPAPPTGAAATGATAGAADGTDLQLRAELALAQLKIASLTADLRSAHASREAIEAELTSLRSLTDARIKHFMGWR